MRLWHGQQEKYRGLGGSQRVHEVKAYPHTHTLLFLPAFFFRPPAGLPPFLSSSPLFYAPPCTNTLFSLLLHSFLEKQAALTGEGQLQLGFLSIKTMKMIPREAAVPSKQIPSIHAKGARALPERRGWHQGITTNGWTFGKSNPPHLFLCWEMKLLCKLISANSHYSYRVNLHGSLACLDFGRRQNGEAAVT